MLKSFPKIFIMAFISIFTVQLFGLVFLSALPLPGQATEVNFTPQVQGLDYKFESSDKTTRNIANYIEAIYKYAIGIVGILAAVVLMFGGVLWIVAGGNTARVGEAKAWIGAALTGLVLALTSYLILNTINPALVNLEITKIPSVAEIKTGSCTSGEVCYDNYTEGDCEKFDGTFSEGLKCSSGCCVVQLSSMINFYSEKKNQNECEDMGGTWKRGEKCPITPCCATRRQCQNVYRVTEQQCRSVIGETFFNYLPDGNCSSNLGEGCVAK